MTTIYECTCSIGVFNPNCPVFVRAGNHIVGSKYEMGDNYLGRLIESTFKSNLTFERLRSTNVKRCEQGFRRKIDAWSPTDWGCALAGEVGELCNLLKKRHRGRPEDQITDEQIADEMADVLTYLDLLAARFDIDLGEALISKFNRVSERIGSDIRL